MYSRMEKYDADSTEKKRTTRNEKLYSEVQNMNIDYVDINVDNAVELSANSNGKSSREDFQKQRELDKILPRHEKSSKIVSTEVEPKEDRVYDIDEILKMARENKLFEDADKKRLINTEYNILTKLDVQSLKTEEMKKEDLRNLIDDIYSKEKKPERKKYPRKVEERLLNDLFDDYEREPELDEELKLQEEVSGGVLNNISLNDNSESNIDSDEPLEENDKQINEEKDNTEDASIATLIGKDKFSKKERNKNKKEKKNKLSDFEKDFKDEKKEEVYDDFIEEKEGKGLLIAIIVVVILIVITCGFFVYEYFFGL